MRIYNTMTRQKQALETLEPGVVKMYVCGPTVYDFFHLGNARPFITFDTLRRYLEYKGLEVVYVQNFTDIDDRMILRANEEGITVRELADRMIDEYFKDADGLNIRRATMHPRATDNIDVMLDMISVLEEKGYAYVSTTGVYFDMEAFERYGRLSGQKIDQLEEGAGQRVDTSDDKRHPLDFALWKFKKPDEPFFSSPWGDGRPGWHIECSAMVKAHLGETIDLHCGGQDLVFPHHENEIAQSEAANGTLFAKQWMHNGFVNIDHVKMAKSAGNFMTVRELAEDYPYEILRFFILQAHYRMPINFSDDLLDAAVSSFERIRTAVENLEFFAKSPFESIDPEADAALQSAIEEAKRDWDAGMSDDLNTADAMAAIFELVRAANQAMKNRNVNAATLVAAKDALLLMLDVMGLDPRAKEATVPESILQLVEQRAKAKAEREFAEADRLRDEVESLGFKIEDTPQGPKVSPLDA
ncbi:MAG TPA: cysteine--tRNA ligase, partial [Fastidiosipila sp.]|jgi:cysteinyl-tRNA synthetase|nr:cysteine--tRNA ligase [Fastidiosipila sp.]